MRGSKRLGTMAVGLGTLALVMAGCGLGGGDQQAEPPVQHHTVKTSMPAAPETTASSVPTTSTPTPSSSPSASDAPSTDPAVAPSSPAVQPSAGQAPRLVRYPGDGVTVQSADDAAKLHGTTDSFRKFVVASVPKGSADCSGGGSITIQAWRADGFAVGDVFACPGGYRAIWGTNGGASWRELVGSQDIWSCKNLERYQVPTSIAGDKCIADGRLKDYRQS